jgi:DNA-binding transcriptional ArsR family regulator
MHSQADIASVASALASRSRSAMINLLLDGRSHPAGDLAREAGVSLSSASGHLAQLIDAGLVIVQRAGRQRRYRLLGPQVAHAIEALASVAPQREAVGVAATEAARLRAGRTCYDHLAGGLGVALTETLVAQGALRRNGQDFTLSPIGVELFESLGIDVTAARSRRRSFAHPCLDWTEQRHHLGGALGAALCERLFVAGWVQRVGSGRAVASTEHGAKSLQAVLGTSVSDQPASSEGDQQ